MASPELTSTEAGEWREAHRYSRSLAVSALLESCHLSKQGQYVYYDFLDGSSRFELR